MAGQSWVMFRCNACGRFSGSRKGQKNISCSHCGVTEGFSVVKEFTSSSELSQAIAMENTPPEIRKELEKALKKKPESFSYSESKSKDPVSLIKSFSNDQGIINIEGLIEELGSSGYSLQESRTLVNEWLEQSEIEGMVIRLASGEYRLL